MRLQADLYFSLVEHRQELSLGVPGYYGARLRLEETKLEIASAEGRVCPECHVQCASKCGLGAHRRYSHGVAGTHRTSIQRRQQEG